MPREINVRLSVRTIISVLAAIAAAWLVLTLYRIFVLLFVAVLLAVAITPAVNRLERWHIPRTVSILAIYALLLVALVGIGFVLVPLVAQQIGLLRVQLPEIVREPLRQGSDLIAERFPELRSTLPTGELAQQAAQSLSGLLGNVGSAALSLGRATVAFLINLVVVLVMGFFLISRRDVAKQAIRLFTPAAYHERLIRVTSQIGRRMGRWVIAQMVIATFYAVFFGMGLSLLGVPYAASLGVIGGLLELVPYVGGFIATILTMIVAFTEQPSLAIWVLVLHLIVGNIEVHVIAPKVLGQAVETHPVVTIMALFAGIELLGIVGAIIAIPLMVVAQALIEEFWLKRIHPELTEPDPEPAQLPAPTAEPAPEG